MNCRPGSRRYGRCMCTSTPACKRGPPILGLRLSDSWPARKRLSTWSLSNRRGLPDVLPLAWNFLERSLTNLHGKACWTQFAQHYRGPFFALQSDQRFLVRYRHDAPDRAALHRPPLPWRRTCPASWCRLCRRCACPRRYWWPGNDGHGQHAGPRGLARPGTACGGRPACGHWTQQNKPEEVNHLLLDCPARRFASSAS